jgi:hypothetical protein
MRASWEWMDIELRLWNGEGHTSAPPGLPGSLALWCFSCPQPSFNLPENWKSDKLSVLHIFRHGFLLMMFSPRWLYRPVLCADGNFHAEKMYMKKAANDVSLHDGEGFVVQSTEYKEHVEARKHDKQPVMSSY